VLFRAH
jgi:hypothetical protein